MIPRKKKINSCSWLIPIEQAVKLKSIGYDKPCLFYSEGEYSNIELTKPIPEDCCSVNLSNISLKNYNESAWLISLPDWHSVFDWFREKGLKFDLQTTITYKGTTYCFYVYSSRVEDWWTNNVDYESYTDCQIALLDELIERYRERGKDEEKE